MAPMVLVEPGPLQGVAGEGSGLPGQVVEGSLQVVEPLPLLPFPPPLEVPLIAFDAFHPGDEQGALIAGDVFGRNLAAPPFRALEARSAVAVNECHRVLRSVRCPEFPQELGHGSFSSRSKSSSVYGREFLDAPGVGDAGRVVGEQPELAGVEPLTAGAVLSSEQQLDVVLQLLDPPPGLPGGTTRS